MRTHDSLLIGNQWRTPHGDGVTAVFSPATEQVVGQVPLATAADVDDAVTVGRAAFDSGEWSALPPAERAEALGRLTKSLKSRASEFTDVITAELGAPRTWAKATQVGSAAAVFSVYRRLAAEYPFVITRPSITGGYVEVRQAPVGVVAAIVPWNAPLFTTALKVAPALVAGCSVVLKPSLEVPLATFVFAEAVAEAGLPDGLVSVVTADDETSAYLVGHPMVDKVSFTGSTAVGRRIAEVCGRNLRRCTLELGGKSAAILAPDAELTDSLVAQLIASAYGGSGQVCMAMSRFLVPAHRYDELIERLTAAIGALRVGDPADDGTDIGPVISAGALRRIEGMVNAARTYARIAIGGRRPQGFDTGHYYEPTLVVDADPATPIAREEVFGPVAVVIPYSSEDDAIRIANATDYGLAASVWTSDADYGRRLAARLAAGSVSVNSANPLDISAPFGGVKASGIGREGGPEGIADYLEYQSIITPGD